jgi:hypothetical protein
MQTTRTSSNVAKPGSPIYTKSVQKSGIKPRPVGKSCLNSMKCTICLKSKTDQELEAIKIKLDKINGDFEASNDGIIHELGECNMLDLLY